MKLMSQRHRKDSREMEDSVLAFLAVYVGASSIFTAPTTFGFDFVTAFSASAMTIANVALRLGDVVELAGRFSCLPTWRNGCCPGPCCRGGGNCSPYECCPILISCKHGSAIFLPAPD